MDLSPSTLVAMMQEANDVHGGSYFKGGCCGETARRTVGASSQKSLKVHSQAILLRSITRPLNKLTQLSMASVEFSPLNEEEKVKRL